MYYYMFLKCTLFLGTSYIFIKWFKFSGLFTLSIKIIGTALIYKKKIYNLLFNKDNDFKISKLFLNNNQTSNNYIKNNTNINTYNTINIEYFYNNKLYNILYNKFFSFKEIGFPIYNKNDLIKRNKFDNTDDSIILVTFKDHAENQLENIWNNRENNVVELLKKYSGPKGNFYTDIVSFENTEYRDFFRKYLLNAACKISNCNIDINNTFIEIMYSNGDIICI